MERAFQIQEFQPQEIDQVYNKKSKAKKVVKSNKKMNKNKLMLYNKMKVK